jgi:hypothetical protein
MEGIMNLPANVGGATSQDGLDSFAPLIASQQAARDIGYPRFTRELLAAGAEIDPVEVQEFLQEIRNAGLTAEDVSMMRRVVEAVFNDPNNYPVVREQLLAEGVPEDILPETFDLEFFTALRMAVEEAENLSREPRPMDQEMPVEMAEGGPVLSGIGKIIPRLFGKASDEALVPIPETKEKSAFNFALSNVLSRLSLNKQPTEYPGFQEDAVARLRQMYPALFGTLVPRRMAEGGIVDLPQMKPIARELAAMGRGGDTMLAHITPQEAMMLKRMGGSGTINPYTGLPEFFLDKVVKGVSRAVRSVGKAVKKFASSTVGRVVTTVALGAFLGPAAAGFLGVSSPAAVAAVMGGVGAFGSGILAGDGLKNSLRSGLTGAALAGGISAIAGGSAAFQARPEFTQAYKDAGGFLGSVRQTASNFFAAPSAEAQRVLGTGETVSQQVVPEVGTATQIQGAGAELGYGDVPFDSFGQAPAGQSLPGYPNYQFSTQGPVPSGAGVSVPTDLGSPFFEGDVSAIRPAAATTAPTTVTGGAGAITPKAVVPESTFLGRTGDFMKDPSFSRFGDIFVDPNATGLARYKPAMYAGGIGLLATQGDKLFATPETEQPDIQRDYFADVLAARERVGQEYPALVYGSFLPPQSTQGYNPGYSFQPVYTAAQGSGPQGVEDFPRKNGHISGPGTGTSDDIPAMLSDGEFVFTAKSVRNMGGGSRRKGAAKMYKLMKMLEGGPVGKTAEA